MSIASYGQHTQFWQDINIQKNWNERWSFIGDGGVRFQTGSGLNVAYLRTGLTFELFKNTVVQAGLAYFYFSPATSDPFHEARPWQGIRSRIPLIKQVDFINYLRLEERMFYYPDQSRFFLRLRFLTGFNVTFYKQENFNVYTPLFIEFFEDLNDHKTFVNHQRWYAGVGLSRYKNKIEIFYIARESRTSSEYPLDVTENIWRIRWYFIL